MQWLHICLFSASSTKNIIVIVLKTLKQILRIKNKKLCLNIILKVAVYSRTSDLFFSIQWKRKRLSCIIFQPKVHCLPHTNLSKGFKILGMKCANYIDYLMILLFSVVHFHCMVVMNFRQTPFAFSGKKERHACLEQLRIFIFERKWNN